MALKLHQNYSRREISKAKGGSLQTYLPFKNNRVTCGCFRVEEAYNPGAPEEVLFGCDEPMPDVEKSANLVHAQGKRDEAIPVFIFRASAQWEYIGDYRCVFLSRDPALLRQKMKEHPLRGTITGILRFEKV